MWKRHSGQPGVSGETLWKKGHLLWVWKNGQRQDKGFPSRGKSEQRYGPGNLGGCGQKRPRTLVTGVQGMSKGRGTSHGTSTIMHGKCLVLYLALIQNI